MTEERTYLEPVTCGECGHTGTFMRDPRVYVECRHCGSQVEHADFQLDADEDQGLEFVDDVLHIRFIR